MIVVYDTNYTHNSNAYLARSIVRGAEAAFPGQRVVQAFNDTLMRLAAGGDCSTLICIDGQRLRADILRRVRPCVETMVLWVFEDPFMLETNSAATPLFDHVFTNDPACVAAYGGKGHYLPLAADPTQDYRPILEGSALRSDVFFAGTMWPNRVASIERLIARLGERRLKLVCPTNDYLPPLPRSIAERCIERPINHSSFVDFANSSSAVLTIYRDYTSGGGRSKASAPGPRYYEVAAAGAPQVVLLESENPGDVFDTIPGNVLCRGIDEACDALAALVADPDDRRRRAEISQAAALDQHLYAHRLKTIADVIERTRASLPTLAAAPARASHRVLFCTHSIKTAAHIGGVEIYQDLLGSMLDRDFALFYWVRTDDRCLLLDRDLRTIESFSAPRIDWLDVLSEPHEEALFSAVVSTYAIDVVHFHHLGHHAASLPLIAKALGVGVLFSVHDYFLICSRYNLLDYQFRFCDIGNRSVLACETCLRIGEGLPSGVQQTRRAFMARVIDSVDVFLFGTRSSADLLARIYPNLPNEKCDVLGVLNDSVDTVELRAPPSGGALHVAITGNVLRSKGADCLLRVIEGLRGSDDFVFHVFGHAEEAYRDVFREMQGATLQVAGGYRNADVKALAPCTVALFLSIWPETFSLSLSEAWQAGMIPIASRIGAYADRIEHGTNGFLVDVGDEAAVIALLLRLRCNPDICARMRGAIHRALWPEAVQHIGHLQDLYRRYSPAEAPGRNAVRIDIGQIGMLPQSSWKERAPPRHILEPPPLFNYALSSDLVTSSLVTGQSRFFVDRIGKLPVDALEEGVASALPISISGWAFAEGEALAGQLQVVLVGERHLIFLDTERHTRGDVTTLHPYAPEYNGFAVDATLRGRWSDGSYYLALLNAVGGQTHLMCTSWNLRLDDGRITEIMASAGDRTVQTFIQDRFRGGTAKSPDAWDLTTLQDVDGEPMVSLEELQRDTEDHATATVRGWFYHPGLDAEKARMFIGVGSGPAMVFKTTPRLERADVKETLNIDELRTGFKAKIQIPPDAGPIDVHLLWSDAKRQSVARFTAEPSDRTRFRSQRRTADA